MHLSLYELPRPCASRRCCKRRLHSCAAITPVLSQAYWAVACCAPGAGTKVNANPQTVDKTLARILDPLAPVARVEVLVQGSVL